MSASDNLGPVIRRLRERWRLTQQDVVEYARLERSSSYISSIETGKTSPTLAELEALAIVFRTDAISLIRQAGGEVQPPAAPDDPAEKLVALYRTLPPEKQELALDFIQFLTERRRRPDGS